MEMAWRGHLSRNLKELRVLFCQTSPASAQTRFFILHFSFLCCIRFLDLGSGGFVLSHSYSQNPISFNSTQRICSKELQRFKDVEP